MHVSLQFVFCNLYVPVYGALILQIHTKGIATGTVHQTIIHCFKHKTVKTSGAYLYKKKLGIEECSNGPFVTENTGYKLTSARALNKKMIPPKFDDLGKEAKDLITKNYHFGVVKLEGNTKAKNGVEFKTEGSHNTDTGNVVGSLETKFKYADYGVTFSEKWNTDNVISTTITVDEKIAKGLKVDFDTTFAPVTGKKSAKVKSAYQHEHLHTTTDVDFDFAGPTIHGSAVFEYNGWHAGYQASYDTANSKLTANNVSLTYKAGDFVIHSGIIDASKYVGSVHHQVNNNLTAGALLNWTAGSTASPSLTVGGKYIIDKETFVKAKLDNGLRLGLSYIQSIRPGVQLTLSSLINAKSLEQGGHKLGLSLNFNA